MNEPAEMNERNAREDFLDAALRGSVGGRVGSAIGAGLSSAWMFSASRTYLSAVGANWRALPAPRRVRLIACVGAVAVLVNRLMSRFGSAEPLGAVLPSIFLAACALAALFADRIAPASERGER
jgi:hypothetical protein